MELGQVRLQTDTQLPAYPMYPSRKKSGMDLFLGFKYVEKINNLNMNIN